MTPQSRADLHVHSRHSDTSGHAGIRALRSAESFTDPVELYHAERARGMEWVTITDHNSLAGSLAIAHLPGTFLGCELDTWFPEDRARVHVVALGIDERTFSVADQARENVYDLVAVLREANVTHYLAHPLFDMSGKLTPETVERMLLLFNVLEGRNGARTSRSNGLLRAIAAGLTRERLEAMAERHGIEPYGETPWRKSLVGGSDDHSGLFAASAYTVAGGDGSVAGFLRAVAAGDCTHGGADGDARTLAHSIYAASFWKIREILRLDEQDGRKRALGLLRKGFGRIGRDVPVLEKTLRGVRRMAPGLYRDGDRRGPAWEGLLDREIGSLLAAPAGINAVDARELNRRLFVVAQRLADDVMGMHLAALLDPAVRLTVRQVLQSLYAVGMVAFLEIPYYFAWSFQSRDRGLQEQLRAHFLGERRSAPRERVAVLCSATPQRAWRGGGCHPPESRAADRRDIDVTLITCSAAPASPGEPVVDFRALAWRPSRNGAGPHWLVPPLVAIVDYIEEERFTAVHTDSTAGQGLVALAASRLLHLPVTGAVDPTWLTAPPPPGGLAGRLRRRYLAWFYGRLDEAFAPTRQAARALIAAGVDPSRVTVLPPSGTHRAGPD
ncbi:MAG: glycosyltransferase [Actinobacteria bacterium]|nr:glycosyltransferase [Actinomycetota bacterium]